MEFFNNFTWRMGNYLSSMKISDIIDILIVAYLIYKVFDLIKRTNSKNLAKALIVFLVVLWLSDLLHLTMINFLLKKAMELGLIAVVILFQPELRRVLERIGSRFSRSGRLAKDSDIENAVKQTVIAASDMSESKTGALIIFEREINLNDIMATGTVLDAEVSAELLKNIFFNKAPLHDGAVVIRNGRIAAAGCVLPLSKSTNLSKDLGMRHRAGIGLSEQSDALVMIVSEETGAISIALEGMLKRHLKPQTADKLLRSELIVDNSDADKGLASVFRSFFNTKGNAGKEESNEKSAKN